VLRQSLRLESRRGWLRQGDQTRSNVRYLEPSTYPAKVAGVIPDDIHTRGIEAQVGLTYSSSRNSGRSSRRRILSIRSCGIRRWQITSRKIKRLSLGSPAMLWYLKGKLLVLCQAPRRDVMSRKTVLIVDDSRPSGSRSLCSCGRRGTRSSRPVTDAKAWRYFLRIRGRHGSVRPEHAHMNGIEFLETVKAKRKSRRCLWSCDHGWLLNLVTRARRAGAKPGS